MRNLLVGVILGLLAIVHSTPVDNVTHFPTRPDDDVLKEVLEDGYLVHETTPRILTTNPPSTQRSPQASQQPPSKTTIPEIEGSGGSNAEPTTASTVQEQEPDVTNSTQPENLTSLQETGDPTPTTQSSQQRFLSSSVPTTEPSTPIFTNKTNDIEDSSGDLMANGSFGSGSGSGSGSGDMQDFVTIFRETTDRSTASSSLPVAEDSETESRSDKASDAASDSRSGSKKTRMFGTSITEMATQQRGHDKVILNDQPPKAEAQHRTPGWIIIVAFIVGLAALVMLCVAIATRDKWNGPHKASQLETKSRSSDPQREQEMSTFVHKESPRENVKAAEYTVIPLDELPEDYSSH